MPAANTLRSFNCPKCAALYQRIKVEVGQETIDREITCRACGTPLPSRDGKFIFKYFLLREAIRSQKWQRRDNSL